ANKLFLLSVIVLAVSFYSIHQSKRLAEGSVVAYTLPSPPSLTGPLSINKGLSEVEYILKDEIKGPESMVVDGDTIYTGTHDGRLLKIVGGKIEKEMRLVKVDRKCGDYENEIDCGRPLGMRRLKGEEFIVVDAYKGVFIVDFNSGSKKQLIDGRMPIENDLAAFFNDIDIINDDEFLFTDSSTVYGRKDFMKEILAAKGTGRVIHHTISTGKSKVLLKGLHFANGIQILPDRQSFVVSELTRAKLTRYYFAGPKASQTETFIDNLPGLPDNIRLSSNGTLWVGLASLRMAGKHNALEAMAEYPKIREILLATLPDLILRDVFPHLADKHAIVVQIDLNGKIVSSLHDVNGEKVREVSQITDSGDYLYLGSFKAPYIAKLKKF
ncbi:hypothetical protein PFISCL1PPCAC_3940, partial [Pristionchus fissidentatus]